MNKLLILGAAGVGKNWLAEQLSQSLNISHFDADDIVWKTKYSVKNTFEIREKLALNISKKKKWIFTGSAKNCINVLIQKSDIILIIQDYYFRQSYRVLKRSYIRWKSGNSEETIFSVLQLLYHLFKKYHLPNASYAKYYRKLAEKHRKKVVFISNKQKQKLAKGVFRIEELYK